MPQDLKDQQDQQDLLYFLQGNSISYRLTTLSRLPLMKYGEVGGGRLPRRRFEGSSFFIPPLKTPAWEARGVGDGLYIK